MSRRRARFGAPVRMEALVVGGINVPSPTFFPAISSVKNSVEPLDDLMILRAVKYPQFLISAHDVYYASSTHRKRIEVLLRDAIRTGNIVLLDSGNYEAYWREREKWWSVQRFRRVSRSTPNHLALCFDELDPKGDTRTLARRVEESVVRDHRSGGQGSTVPVVHAPSALLPATVKEVARRLRPIVVALPERELGEGLYER